MLAITGALTEPLARPTAQLARRATLRHTREERRRRHFSPTLHAGDPAVQVRSVEIDAAVDDALATDCVMALHRWARSVAGDDVLLWVTRPGDLAPGELDLTLVRAVDEAERELGVPVPLIVVVHHAWRDPRTGVSRHWVRLR